MGGLPEFPSQHQVQLKSTHLKFAEVEILIGCWLDQKGSQISKHFNIISQALKICLLITFGIEMSGDSPTFNLLHPLRLCRYVSHNQRSGSWQYPPALSLALKVRQGWIQLNLNPWDEIKSIPEGLCQSYIFQENHRDVAMNLAEGWDWHEWDFAF